MEMWIVFHKQDPNGTVKKRVGTGVGALIEVRNYDGRVREDVFTANEIAEFGIILAHFPDNPHAQTVIEDIAMNRKSINYAQAHDGANIVAVLKDVPEEFHKSEAPIHEVEA